MSVEREESGRRRVQAEVVVPGTPEEVWRAIATGPGVSSWFVPTEVDEKVGGEVRASFGPGMDSVSKIVAWDPPRRLEAESNDLGPDAPPVATEWIVEARDGGTCVVRVVHSLFADSDDWDNELEAWESGWPDFFRILRLYLQHFAGQPATLVPLMAVTSHDATAAWDKLTAALGTQGVGEGEERAVDVPEPALRIHVERVGRAGEGPHAHELLVRTTEPAPGLAHWFAMKMGEQTLLSLRFFFYGDGAAEVAERAGPAWHAWLEERFPAPQPPQA
ncbi:MAG: SRPBCC domain-containing protein [Planctomycetota bacterium]